MAHAARKRDNAQKIKDQVQKDAEKQQTKLDGFKRDLETVRNAANAAQGECRTL